MPLCYEHTATPRQQHSTAPDVTALIGAAAGQCGSTQQAPRNGTMLPNRGLDSSLPRVLTRRRSINNACSCGAALALRRAASAFDDELNSSKLALALAMHFKSMLRQRHVLSSGFCGLRKSCKLVKAHTIKLSRSLSFSP